MTVPPGVRVREACTEDLQSIAAIYAHHVRHGLASFEETPPDVAEIGRRFEALVGAGLPYLAAEIGEGIVAGYAHAGPYRPRPAYRFTVENSVYVAPDSARRGIGRALLGELIRRCTALGYRRMVAIIGDSENHPSIRLHDTFGFSHAGTLPSVGFKFGRWVDSVIMQRPLGTGDENTPGAPPTGWRE